MHLEIKLAIIKMMTFKILFVFHNIVKYDELFPILWYYVIVDVVVLNVSMMHIFKVYLFIYLIVYVVAEVSWQVQDRCIMSSVLYSLHTLVLYLSIVS